MVADHSRRIIASFRSVGRRLLQIWASLRNFFVEDFWGPKLAKIAADFCAEAAVLIAVFPILDTIINKGGLKDVTWPLIGWSVGLPVILLVFAGVITAIIKEAGKD